MPNGKVGGENVFTSSSSQVKQLCQAFCLVLPVIKSMPSGKGRMRPIYSDIQINQFIRLRSLSLSQLHLDHISTKESMTI